MKVHYIPDRSTWEFNGRELEEPPDPNLFMSIYDTDTMSEVRIMFRRRVQPSNILGLNYEYSTLLFRTYFDLDFYETILLSFLQGCAYVAIGKALVLAYEFLRRVAW